MNWEYWIDKTKEIIIEGFEKLTHFILDLFIPIYEKVCEWITNLGK